MNRETGSGQTAANAASLAGDAASLGGLGKVRSWWAAGVC